MKKYIEKLKSTTLNLDLWVIKNQILFFFLYLLIWLFVLKTVGYNFKNNTLRFYHDDTFN